MEGKRKLKATHAKKIVQKKKIEKKKVEKVKKEKTEYVYTKLEDMMVKTTERLYLYASLMDCGNHYYSKSADKWLCVGKLIDSTVNPAEKNDYLSVTFFARNKDELPKPTKIGSIIRIHRGETHEFKKKLQLNVDVDIKASWVLFDPVEGNMPIEHTGKNFTWVEKDNERLKEARKFAKEFFGKNDLAYISLTEAAKKQPEDFDTVLQVLDVKKNGKDIKFKLCDAEKYVTLRTQRQEFQYIAPQDIIRIRSAYYDLKDKEFKTLTLQEYSGILRVPKEYHTAKELLSELKGKKVPDEIKSLIEVYTPLVDKENIISKVKAGSKAVPVALKDLSAEAAKGKNKTFRISANVIEVGPKNVEEWLWIHDTKSKENQKPSDVFGKGKLTALPAGKEYYYKMQLYVKDKSVMDDTNMYIVFLCTVDGKGADFIDIGLKRDRVADTHYKDLKKIYKKLTRPWNKLDLIVEAVEVAGGQTVYFIVDTELKI